MSAVATRTWTNLRPWRSHGRLTRVTSVTGDWKKRRTASRSTPASPSSNDGAPRRAESAASEVLTTTVAEPSTLR